MELGTGYGYNLFSLHRQPPGLDPEGFRYLAERHHRGTRNRRPLRSVGQDFVRPYRSDRRLGSQPCRDHGQGRPHLFLHRADSVRRPEGDRKYHCCRSRSASSISSRPSKCSIWRIPAISSACFIFARSITRRSCFPRSTNLNARDGFASSHANGCLLRHRSTTTGFCIAGSQHDHGQRRRYRASTEEAEDQPVSPPALACEPHRSRLGHQDGPHQPAARAPAPSGSNCSTRFRSSRNGARPAASSARKVMSMCPRWSTAASPRQSPTSPRARSTGLMNSTAKQQLGHKSFWVSLLDEDLVNGAFATDHPFVRYALQPGVLRIMGDFMHELPQLSDVLLTLSQPDREQAAELFAALASRPRRQAGLQALHLSDRRSRHRGWPADLHSGAVVEAFPQHGQEPHERRQGLRQGGSIRGQGDRRAAPVLVHRQHRPLPAHGQPHPVRPDPPALHGDLYPAAAHVSGAARPVSAPPAL